MPMPNVIDSLLRTIGPVIWEVKIMAETAGDTPMDVPVAQTKNHRVYGNFRLATTELLEKIGTSTQGDALLVSRDVIDPTSQILYNDIYYEITKRIDADPLYAGKMYTYVLHRYGKRRDSV